MDSYSGSFAVLRWKWAYALSQNESAQHVTATEGLMSTETMIQDFIEPETGVIGEKIPWTA